ncbi:hypothetical protein FLX27_25880 [Agrobacterium tumefaciens]|nr:hypothetical protein FLX27_25880 [Agrobacterium tumefaciens]
MRFDWTNVQGLLKARLERNRERIGQAVGEEIRISPSLDGIHLFSDENSNRLNSVWPACPG